MSGPTLGELNITVNAGDSEAKVRSLSSSLDQLARQERLRAEFAYADRFQTDAQAQAMGRAETQAYKFAKAMEAGGNAAGAHGLQLGRLRMELGTLVGRLTDTSTALDRMGGALGGMAIGDPLVIGALAGIAGIGMAYEALTKSTRDAAEAQKDLEKEFLRIAHMSVASQGEAASLLNSGDPFGDKVARQSLAQLRAQAAALERQSHATTLQGGPGGVERVVSEEAKKAATQMKELNKEIERRNTLLQSIAGPGGTITQAGTLQAAAEKAGFITDKLKAEAEARKEDLRVRKQVEDQERRNIEAAQKGIAQTNERIAQLKVEIDADGRMALAKSHGQDAVDALTAALAGEAAARDAAGKAMPARIQELKALAEQHAKNTIAARNSAEAEKSLADIVTKGVETLKRVAKEGTEAQAAEAKRYDDQMRQDWIRGIDGIIAHGLGSFHGFFDGVLRMFQQLLATMEKAGKADGIGAKLLGLGSAAIGGGLAGYQIGQSSGSGVVGALGGAASGALAGSAFGAPGIAVGAVAGFIGGIIGAGNAAKEAAKQMHELQASLALNIESIKASLSGDVLGQAIAKVKADFDALRKQTEDAYSGGGAGSEQVRNRNTVLAQLNSLEAQRIQQLRDEAAVVLQQLNENVEIQILRNNGLTDEADAMEKAIDQERRFAELRKQGIDDATIERLRQSEIARDAAEERRKAADAAAVAAADAIEKAAKAAQAAADAAQKAFEQARATQDLDVELLNAQGRTTEAANLEFQLQQQRRLEDAKKLYGDDSDFVSKLQQLQQIQRDQRAAQSLIDSTIGPSSGYGRGAASAQAAVMASIDQRTSLMVVDLMRSEVSILSDIRSILRNGGTGAGGGGAVFNINIRKELTRENIEDVVDEVREQLSSYANEDIGTATQRTSLRTGSVNR